MQAFGANGARILLQTQQVLGDLVANRAVELTKVPLGGGSQLNAIDQRRSSV